LPIATIRNAARRKRQRAIHVVATHPAGELSKTIKQVDEHFPGKRIILVMDNLNTHKLSSLYATLEPEEARKITECLEIHYTPKHGSWLDIAEIEIGVISRQCLNRGIPDQKTLRTEIAAW